MTEITLVTAYFNINRKDWKGFERTDNDYLSYFRHWARMRNKLIVYTTPDMAKEVMRVRKEYGLVEKTTVIAIEDITACVPDIYKSIKRVMLNKSSWLFHKNLNNPESWNYLYNYVTNLKTYWAQRAVSEKLASGMIAWIDFGFDHGGDDFPFSEDFDFTWNYTFSPKVNIFVTHPLDNTPPIFEIVHTMDTYIRGAISIAPDFMWIDLWKDIYSSLNSLLECGLADDDQTLMLMAYRRHPENFDVHLTSYWGAGLRDYGGEKLRVRSEHKIVKKHTFHKLWREKRKEWKIRFDILKRHGSELEKKYYSD